MRKTTSVSLCLLFVAAAALTWRPAFAASALSQQPGQAHTEKAAEGQHGEEAEHEGWLPTIAKVFNFALLAWILAHYLKTPIQTHLATRETQIRQDLVNAAELRRTAAAREWLPAKMTSAAPTVGKSTA